MTGYTLDIWYMIPGRDFVGIPPEHLYFLHHHVFLFPSLYPVLCFVPCYENMEEADEYLNTSLTSIPDGGGWSSSHLGCLATEEIPICVSIE
jgi:hypothetical protein